MYLESGRAGEGTEEGRSGGDETLVGDTLHRQHAQRALFVPDATESRLFHSL
jgi:hypothetical protein